MNNSNYKDLIYKIFYNKKQHFGPFVYRLGHVVFILERGVRFPQGPPKRQSISMLFHVYLIKTIKGFKNKSYVGYTNNIKSRLSKHNSSKGAKSTKGYRWELVYKKVFKNKSKALSYEYKLKKDRVKRIDLINGFDKKKY